MTAHCDIETGKIFGCKEGSKDWYHEQAHFIFNSEEKTSKLNLYKERALTVWMMVVSIGLMYKPIWIIAVILAIGIIGVEMYEEKWCQEYADNKIKLDAMHN